MPVQTTVNQAEKHGQYQREYNKINSNYRIGHEWIESFVGKIAGVIKGVPALTPGWKAWEKYQSRGVK